ncbi:MULTISPECIES: amidase domain-containing protein [Kitasatospora]|uniref:Putative amidase domain-containing protein n=1 Tax=Kitasatospora cystarginea TaxID=58350 RepID=A0ABN3EIY2_9ACTN
MDLTSLKAARSIDVDAAADGWMELSKESWQAVNDIHANGVDPLKDDWKDRVGEAAGRKLEEQAQILEAGADLTRSVAMILDGLSAEITRAKLTMQAGLDLAQNHGLAVDMATAQVRDSAGSVSPDAAAAAQEVNALLREALREAEQADHQAAAELRKLGAATTLKSPDAALNEQYAVSRLELAMYSGGIPDGKDPRLVADWWNALPDSQKKQLMLSDPVTLANLPGIPEDVKQNVRGGPGAKYDRVKAVQWAMEHWNDNSGDFEGEENCTNFVSEALHQSGMKFKGWNTMDGDGWFRGGGSSGLGSWVDGVIPGHTHAWGGAQNQHDFMLKHGGQEISPDQVRPGDIVYYEEDAEGTDVPKGQIFHTAIVTAVTPRGDIRYTAHNGSKLNASVEGRLPSFEESRGHLKVHYVRVNPDWY